MTLFEKAFFTEETRLDRDIRLICENKKATHAVCELLGLRKNADVREALEKLWCEEDMDKTQPMREPLQPSKGKMLARKPTTYTTPQEIIYKIFNFIDKLIQNTKNKLNDNVDLDMVEQVLSERIEKFREEYDSVLKNKEPLMFQERITKFYKECGDAVVEIINASPMADDDKRKMIYQLEIFFKKQISSQIELFKLFQTT